MERFQAVLRSAGFQPAVSPISNRQIVQKTKPSDEVHDEEREEWNLRWDGTFFRQFY
jgi:hypothetical protein